MGSIFIDCVQNFFKYLQLLQNQIIPTFYLLRIKFGDSWFQHEGLLRCAISQFHLNRFPSRFLSTCCAIESPPRPPD